MIDAYIEDDSDVRAALDWLADASGNAVTFFARLDQAQEAYRTFTASDMNRGRDPGFSDIGSDVVAAFCAQAKSFIDDRRSYDFALASKTVPWIKQLGCNIGVLNGINGARERAARMLRSKTVLPDSALFELVIASNYAADGLNVEFIEEAKGRARTPDLRLTSRELSRPVVLECKRLGCGEYEQAERERHRHLFRYVAELIDSRGLSVDIDVTYTHELVDVPDYYLAAHLQQALSTPIVTLGTYPWMDEYGCGEIRAARLADARADIQNNGSLYFGTKLARLLSGRVVRESSYHLAAGAEPDHRDTRFIDKLHYGSVVTWQCIAPAAIEKKSRYVKGKLVEADKQLQGHGPAIAHLAMDAELACESSDLRHARNIETVVSFVPTASLVAIYLHYLVPRISEAHSWVLDETVDTFGPFTEPMTPARIFPQSKLLENGLPAWKQPLSPP
ncbi:hypothetical protein [Burkholderia cepacia]|uniref:hypothetical protein n=1 Tax=Burkholderia cepacia TaxID=292 RepID=UPI001295A797|nr:hypothetical protein [Burkholderia cepacia]QFS37078.1 hypothetical protein BURCE16_10000 [Burkholderia cepacia]